MERRSGGVSFTAIVPLILGCALLGCGAAKPDPKTPIGRTRAEALGPAAIAPVPLTSPQAKILVTTLDALNDPSLRASVCASSATVQDLTTILDAKSEYDRAAGAAVVPALNKLAAAVNQKPVSATPPPEAEVRAIMEAARAKVADLQKSARNDAKFRTSAETLVGGECNAECVDNVVTACTSPETRLTRRSEAGVTGALLPGLSWQSTLATGAANFLKDRALSEAALWIINDVQQSLCKPAMKPYFQHTCDLVESTPGRVGQLAGAMALTAVRADLEELPIKVFHEYYFSKDPKSAEDTYAGEDATKLLWQVFDGIRRGDSPLTLLAGLESNPHLRGECPDPRQDTHLACTLRRIGGLVGMLGGGASQATNRSADEPDFRRLALQLKEGITQIKNNQKLCPAAAAELTRAKNNATAPRGTADSRKNDLAICSIPDPDPARLEDIFRLSYRLSQRLQQYADQPAMSNEHRLIASGELLQQTVALMRSVEELWSAANTASQRWKDLELAISATNEILRGQRSEGALHLLDLIARREDDCAKRRGGKPCVPEKLLKHATLVVDIASAQKPEDVQAALEAASAPVGSWRVKRTEAPIATVTGLVGATAGFELPASGDHPGQYAAGALGMVGVDTSWFGGSAGTFGMFFSLVDFGQLLTTPIRPTRRSISETTTGRAEGGAEFELVQLLAPGAHVRYGIGNTPLVIGCGYSLSPRLRKYEVSDTASGKSSDESFTVHRFMGFVAIDVTMFPL